MPIFGRKQHVAPSVLVSSPGVGKLPANQVPAKLRVVAVTAPGQPQPVPAALVTGLLLGPFPLQLAQVTAALPEPSWPEPDQELAAVADPAHPLNFAVVWGTGEADGDSAGWRTAHGWDPGPSGTHERAVATYLAEAGFFPGDFGPTLETTVPGLATLIAESCAARGVTVIPGQVAVSLAHTGEPASGVVAEVRKLPLPPQLFRTTPEGCMAWLTLDVTPPDGQPYRSTIRFGFRTPERFAALATSGTHLPLRFDPANRAVVTIDLPALGITPL